MLDLTHWSYVKLKVKFKKEVYLNCHLKDYLLQQFLFLLDPLHTVSWLSKTHNFTSFSSKASPSLYNSTNTPLAQCKIQRKASHFDQSDNCGESKGRMYRGLGGLAGEVLNRITMLIIQDEP